MNESTTRKELIDIQLKQAGWNIDDRTLVISEFVVNPSSSSISEPISSYGNNQFADYVLLGKNGREDIVIKRKTTHNFGEIGQYFNG